LRISVAQAAITSRRIGAGSADHASAATGLGRAGRRRGRMVGVRRATRRLVEHVNLSAARDRPSERKQTAGIRQDHGPVCVGHRRGRDAVRPVKRQNELSLARVLDHDAPTAGRVIARESHHGQRCTHERMDRQRDRHGLEFEFRTRRSVLLGSPRRGTPW
jgi:hypothetical protein